MIKRIANIALLLIFLITTDLLVGYFLVPVIIKKISGIDIHEHQRIHTLHPYYNHGFNRNQSATKTYGNINYTLHTNSLGMTDSYTKRIDPRKKNIVFIGDSYTEGIGIPFNKTFCGLLQQKIDTSHTNILNAGVASFSPKLYYLRIKYLIEVQQLIPNEIYSLPDYSDYGDELVYEDFKPTQSFNTIKIRHFLSSKSILYNFYHWLMRKWFIKQLGSEATEAEGFIYSIKTSNDFLKRYPDFLEIRQHWLKPENMKKSTFITAKQLAETNMDSLNVLCSQYNISLTIVGYPRESYNLLNQQQLQHVESFWKDYSSQRNIPYISLYGLLLEKIKHKNIYIKGDNHWNEAGHSLIAEKLLHYVTTQK